MRLYSCHDRQHKIFNIVTQILAIMNETSNVNKFSISIISFNFNSMQLKERLLQR